MTLLYLYLLVFTFGIESSSGDSSTVHPHQGKVSPYPPGDPKIKLDDKALALLNTGQPYQVRKLAT